MLGKHEIIVSNTKNKISISSLVTGDEFELCGKSDLSSLLRSTVLFFRNNYDVHVTMCLFSRLRVFFESILNLESQWGWGRGGNKNWRKVAKCIFKAAKRESVYQMITLTQEGEDKI